MRFPYDPLKAAQATAYLAHLYGGEIALFRAMKLIYLADRSALIDIGRSITGDRLVNMDQGGVPSETYNALKLEDKEDSLQEPWSIYLRPTARAFDFESIVEPSALVDLSRYEMELLTTVHKRYGYMKKDPLVDFMHSLQEWKDPEGSSFEVDPVEILRNANKSPEEIREIALLAEEAWFLASIGSVDSP